MSPRVAVVEFKSTTIPEIAYMILAIINPEQMVFFKFLDFARLRADGVTGSVSGRD